MKKRERWRSFSERQWRSNTMGGTTAAAASACKGPRAAMRPRIGNNSAGAAPSKPACNEPPYIGSRNRSSQSLITSLHACGWQSHNALQNVSHPPASRPWARLPCRSVNSQQQKAGSESKGNSFTSAMAARNTGVVMSTFDSRTLITHSHAHTRPAHKHLIALCMLHCSEHVQTRSLTVLSLSEQQNARSANPIALYHTTALMR